MEKLSDKSCVLCVSDSKPVTAAIRAEYMKELSGWKISNSNNIDRLSKSYQFSNFADALNFTNIVGELAELENHHPSLITEWGKVRVVWWTHSINGLFDNDFILAARTDALYQSIT